MRLSRYLLALAMAGACAASACSGGDDDDGSAVETGDEMEVAETQALFGDDRVRVAMKANPKFVPKTFADLEKLFGIGRACRREDSREIYVVEEPATRAGGHQSSSEGILPRAVVTGCNTDISNPNSTLSFSLMAALISSPDAPNAALGDPMIIDERLEVMALDDKTGLYNFYVFNADGPGSMKRVQRAPDGTIKEFNKHPRKKLVTQKSGEGCFTCHPNGGPLMNEMSDPWTNWISTRKELPKEANFSGETQALVSEAKSLDGSHQRSSLSNQLEQIMKLGIAAWVEGPPGTVEHGHTRETLAGFQPGGIKRLLESAFCQTEVNYASALDTVPLELFADPEAIRGAGIERPAVGSGDPVPVLMPVRSEMDRRIQISLQKLGYIANPTALAIRLVDDQNDIFSSARCDLLSDLAPTLPEKPGAPAEVDQAIRAFLKKKLAAGLISDAKRKAYVAALLDAKLTTDASVTAVRTAYFESAKARINADFKLLGSSTGRAKLKQRADARKVAVRVMFPGDVNPLPILD